MEVKWVRLEVVMSVEVVVSLEVEVSSVEVVVEVEGKGSSAVVVVMVSCGRCQVEVRQVVVVSLVVVEGVSAWALP